MSNNKFYVTPVANSIPYDNQNTGLQTDNLQEFIDGGIIVKNISPVQYSVASGYTRMHPNLVISEGIEITIDDGGELIVL